MKQQAVMLVKHPLDRELIRFHLFMEASLLIITLWNLLISKK